MSEDEKIIIDAYDAYADAIFRFCSFMLTDRERALEIMQETFTKTWEYQQKGNVVEQIRPFLYMTARNLCRNEITRRPTMTSIEELAEAGSEFEDETLPSPETAAELELMREAIQQLPEEMREAMIMRHVDGLPVSEIARILNESENAVSVRIHRAIKRLQKHFHITP
jgi:RNA polymerase sigma-70 factor (ECF subfamily)